MSDHCEANTKTTIVPAAIAPAKNIFAIDRINEDKTRHLCRGPCAVGLWWDALKRTALKQTLANGGS